MRGGCTVSTRGPRISRGFPVVWASPLLHLDGDECGLPRHIVVGGLRARLRIGSRDDWREHFEQAGVHIKQDANGVAYGIRLIDERLRQEPRAREKMA